MCSRSRKMAPPRRRLVAANALEHTRSIVDDMAHHVDGGVLPVHELAVAPDLRGSSRRSGRSLEYPRWLRPSDDNAAVLQDSC